MTYGILYGAKGRPDYAIDSGYATIDAARRAYRPERRVRYSDDVLGGADIVRLDASGAPVETVETLAEDAEPCVYCGEPEAGDAA